MIRLAFGVTLAALLALFFLFLTYPGTLTPDSITSWNEAFRGQFTTLKPPLLALLQSLYLLPLSIERAVAAFSLTQGMLFWLSIFLCLYIVTNRVVPFVLSCLAALLFVPLWGFTTVHWTDVWVLIFFLFAMTSFEALRQSGYKGRSYLLFGIVFAFLAVATRHNAVSMLPVIVPPVASWIQYNWRARKLQSAGLAVLLIPILFAATNIFLLMPQVHITPSLAPFGLLNQYLGTIAHSPEDRKEQLLTREAPLFDAHFGSGSLLAAVETYEPRFNGKLVWGVDSILRFNNLRGFETVLESGDFITSAFLRIVRASPEGFVRHKMAYMKGQFGVGSVRNPLGAGVHANTLGLKAKPFLPALRRSLASFAAAKAKTFVFQHWFSFVFGGIALLIHLFMIRTPLAAWLFSGAVLYAIPYILFETGWEWRYLMPSYVMNVLSFAVVLNALVERFACPTGSYAAVSGIRPQWLFGQNPQSEVPSVVSVAEAASPSESKEPS